MVIMENVSQNKNATYLIENVSQFYVECPS